MHLFGAVFIDTLTDGPILLNRRMPLFGRFLINGIRVIVVDIGVVVGCAADRGCAGPDEAARCRRAGDRHFLVVIEVSVHLPPDGRRTCQFGFDAATEAF